jgi:hypothetical protein
MPASHLTNPLDAPGGWHPPREQPTIQLVPEPEDVPRRRGLYTGLASRRALAALALALAAATLVIYFPVHALPFVSLNDAEYVTQNVRIQQLNWDSAVWWFTTFHAANWHPLTWLSHALDFRLFGLNPGAHHAVNLLLHVANAVLLFWVLWRATGYAGRSFMVAALFALHPINVESVAWVAERKNLLSMFFLLLALGAYRWYARRPGVARYSVVAGLYALGLMSKPQVITLPFLLLLWDYWPLERVALHSSPSAVRRNGPGNSGEKRPANTGKRRFLWLALEKVPLLMFAAISAVLTMHAQHAGGAMGGALRFYPLPLRVENALISYSRYVGKAIWPAHLAFFYPHPSGFQAQQVWQATVLLLLATTSVFYFHTRRYLFVGWLWFLGALVPMIGLVQVGGQAMADRYAYLPFVGLFIAGCWGAADLAQLRHVRRIWVAGVCVAVLALLMLATRRQLGYWSSDLALWSHTVEVTSNNSAAENLLGETLQRAGHMEDAIVHFRAASAMDPLLPFPRYHIGVYEAGHGDPREALAQFENVIAVTESDQGVLAELRADTFLRMSSAYEALGDFDSSKRCLALALMERHKEHGFEATMRP